MADTDPPSFPDGFFRREDESPDEGFYGVPRLVQHIDDATISALTQLYAELIPPGARVLDLMSSWVSHLPPDVAYAHVAGLGMNALELDHNPRLHERVVHDLNQKPELPFLDESFDFAVCAVSIQYLTRPVEVFASVRRILAPGGSFLVATSHRLFPTKATFGWRSLGRDERMRLLATYFALAGGWEAPRLLDRSPPGADPLWVVTAQRSV